MSGSRATSWPVRFLFLMFALFVGGLIGTQYERFSHPRRAESARPQSNISVNMALELAEKGDSSQAAVLLRQGLHRAGRDPESYYYVWKAVQHPTSPLGKVAFSDGLYRELLDDLNAAMLDVDSFDAFARLYKLHSAIVAQTSTHRVGSTSKSDNETPVDVEKGKTPLSNPSTQHDPASRSPSDPVALMRAGLESLTEGDGDRAEFLTEAALRSQPLNPTSVPRVWKEYEGYLESNKKLSPYDKLARLSAYGESINECLLASRNLPDFQEVFAVRMKVLGEQSRSHEALVGEIASAASALAAKVKQAADSHESRAIALRSLASDAVELKQKALVGLALGSEKGRSSKPASDSIRQMVSEAISIARSDLGSLKNRTEIASVADRKGETLDPEDPAKVGDFEIIAADSIELSNCLEDVDLISWIQMANSEDNGKSNPKLSQEMRVTSNNGDSGLDSQLRQVLIEVERLQAEVGRRQVVRYNLWALRRIYRAESSANWDVELGRIEVSLLHPTVNALYSSTYDTLVRKQTDPQIRTRKVQNLLNSNKQVLSAF